MEVKHIADNHKEICRIHVFGWKERSPFISLLRKNAFGFNRRYRIIAWAILTSPYPSFHLMIEEDKLSGLDSPSFFQLIVICPQKVVFWLVSVQPPGHVTPGIDRDTGIDEHIQFNELVKAGVPSRLWKWVSFYSRKSPLFHICPRVECKKTHVLLAAFSVDGLHVHVRHQTQSCFWRQIVWTSTFSSHVG
jgi:hypothetical protein